ncbi:MAG: hypothetical protein C5B52_09565 [Bacteroidetes bacterium]|nr:MAG: hypothetical protein C5B52_09565 [Bacteroidota bacterium]
MIKTIILSFFEDCIRNCSGPIGRKFRQWYYRGRLGSCGRNVKIDTGVYFENPKEISLGDNVWIDKNCILIAGTLNKKNTRFVNQANSNGSLGKIKIGSNSHIGIGTVMQGHGGITTGEFFTTSAYCRIYSFSNDYKQIHHGTQDSSEFGESHYVVGPVEIGKNVWLGLNVSVISCNLGNDSFILPHSVVYHSIDANSVAGGNPASKQKSRFE